MTQVLRDALDTGYLRPLLDILPEQVPWSPAPEIDTEPRSATQLLVWLASLQIRGFRAKVDETFTYPDAVVLGLDHDGRPGAQLRVARYLVFLITGEQITKIAGYDDRAQALQAAFDHA